MNSKSTSLTIAAGLLLLTACGRVPIKYDFGVAELKMFSDCNQIQSTVYNQLDAYRRDLQLWPRGTEGDMASAPVAGTSGDKLTNLQEQGVDEADQTKVGKDQIYTVSGDNIQVTARLALTDVGVLPITGMNQVKLYVQDDLLIAIGQSVAGNDALASGTVSRAAVLNTQVRTYRSTGGNVLPTVLGTRTFAGALTDSRLTAGRLILIMNTYLDAQDDLDKPLSANPVAVTDNKVSGTACSSVMQPPLLDQDFRLLKVASVDVTAPQTNAYEIALMGSGDQIYMSTDALYVAKNSLRWRPWTNNPTDKAAYEMLRERLVITKIAFDKTTGALTPTAIGIAAGYTKDQFSYQELTRNNKSYLAVAATTGFVSLGGESTAQNHLWVLGESKGKLNLVGQVNNFGSGEDIRSVRFIDSMAYVVTFKKTDPLFAIDLSDPENPQLKGALEIPGFSTYLQPIAHNRVVGLGFDAHDMGDYAWFQGIQVSLFDVSNAQSPLRIDNRIYGDRGSSSEATWDHHAFFADADLGLIAFPLVQLARPAHSSPETYGDVLTFSGAVILRLTNDRLVEQARITHSEWMPASCSEQARYGQWWQSAQVSQDIRRIFEVDGKLLSISAWGIKQHSLADPSQTLKALEFSVKAPCTPYSWYN